MVLVSGLNAVSVSGSYCNPAVSAAFSLVICNENGEGSVVISISSFTGGLGVGKEGKGNVPCFCFSFPEGTPGCGSPSTSACVGPASSSGKPGRDA